TPQNDSEFGTKTSVTLRYTDPMNAAAGRVDLLTAIEHEMGHKLGLNDTYLEKDRDSLMYGYLTVGERRLPSRDQAKGTRPNVSSTHFLSLEPESGEILIAPALSNDSQLRSSTMNIALLRSSVDGFAEAFRKHFDPAELRAGIRGQSEIRDQKSDVRLNHGRRKADGGKQKAVGRRQKAEINARIGKSGAILKTPMPRDSSQLAIHEIQHDLAFRQNAAQDSSLSKNKHSVRIEIIVNRGESQPAFKTSRS